MDVILSVIGQVVVEHDFNVLDVDAARGDVGGNEEFEARFAELVHHAVAHGLGHFAVETVRRVSLGIQMLDQFVHHAPGVAEDDAEFEIVNVDEAREQIHFETPVHFIKHLLDGRHRHCLLLDANVLGVARVFLDQLLDRARDGRREEDGLPFFGRPLENQLDVVAKAHVEHDIDLIKHNHLHRIEPQRAAAHVVHDATGRADDNMRALLQSKKLAVVGLATVDRQSVETAFEERQFVDLLGNLHGQFTGRA